MKYIAVQFFSEYQKSYTYKSNIRRLKVNDFVVVPTVIGNTVAKVVKLDLPIPHFECKEVIKKVEL